jgi:hypothetical protein
MTGRTGRGRLTRRDLEMLSWLARQRVATAEQLARLFGLDVSKAYRRLRALRRLGLVRHERIFHGQPGVYLATLAGVAWAGEVLPAAKLDIRTLRHDLIVTELCVAYLRAGLVVTTEREMRVSDSGRRRPRYAALLGGDGPGGGPRLHFPDLLAHQPDGLWAVEVELVPKRRRRLDQIVGAYVRARHLSAVVYYTGTPRVDRLVRDAVGRADAVDFVRVRQLVGSASTLGPSQEVVA